MKATYLNLLLLEDEGASHDVDLILLQVVVLVRHLYSSVFRTVLSKSNHLDELHEPLLVVDGSDLAAEDEVEQLADGPGERGCEEHEELGDGDGARPHGQPVPGADRLRDDLAKNNCKKIESTVLNTSVARSY